MPNIDRHQSSIKQDSCIKRIIHFLANAVLTILFILSIGTFVYSLFFTLRAKRLGEGIGTAEGKTAGRLMGSYNGISQGVSEGAQEGHDAGLSAEDTEVDISTKIEGIGKLEVLSASVVLHDVQGISDKYRTLFAFYGEITFTVDMNNIDINNDKNEYTILLPNPEATLRLDEKKSEQLATQMEHSWSGSNEDGYTAAMNTIKQLSLNAEESVSNYDYLMNSAKESADKQVKYLIQSMTKEEVKIRVEFKE